MVRSDREYVEDLHLMDHLCWYWVAVELQDYWRSYVGLLLMVDDRTLRKDRHGGRSESERMCGMSPSTC